MKSTQLATLASLASVALADLPTLTSTIVSSSCSLGPSTFKFSNDTTPVTHVAPEAESTSELESTQLPSSSSEEVIYETDVVTNDSIFTTDRVVCNGGSCYTTTGLETWVTTTDTIDGILTTYLTHVPVTSTEETEASAAATTTQAPESVVTESEIGTTIVTITSCSGNKCEPTAVTTGLTVVTSTIKGVETIYTTYCPISSELSVKPKKTIQSTTVATVTVCSEEVCQSSAVTTGVTELTTTIHGVESIYTTYCPIESSTSEQPSEPVKEITSSETEYITITKSEDHETSAPAPSGTVNVITNNIVTQYSKSSSVASVVQSTTPLVSTYEGAAAQAAPVVFGLVPIVLALM